MLKIAFCDDETAEIAQLEELLDDLNEWAPREHVSLSLPSLRVDNFSQSLIGRG